MDLRWGFNNVRIRSGDEAKATFITPLGLYEPTVMQFGLCNTPSTFQRMIDQTLKEELETGKVVVYIDDILVHTNSCEENRKITRAVLGKLEKESLKCHSSKCMFKALEVEFLGVRMAREGLSVTQSKVATIKKEKPPKNKKLLRRFLGMTGYHRRFIRDYATKA
jgi:hypothetical protein